MKPVGAKANSSGQWRTFGVQGSWRNPCLKAYRGSSVLKGSLILIINNLTNSSRTAGYNVKHYMLPKCNREWNFDSQQRV